VFAGLKIHNTLTRKLELFEPISGNRVFMFVCGPTVYDYSHLGHARVFVFFDVVARYLRWLGYSLFYIVNITDVDDKIITRAKERNTHPLVLAREFEQYFREDMLALNITSPNLYPRASDYLKEIFWQIEILLKKGYAYTTETGVYFDITKFSDYGKLSGRKPDELRVHRIEPDPTKRNPGDFALWRKRPADEFGWDSPWGYGRPGWHIEDTAITIRHFGEQYDIHGGAIELAFPHHEAEIAQAESVTGVKPFVKYWMHTGLLTVEGKKMSKSLGNVINIRDALKKYEADAIRLFILMTHYRSPLDFTWDLLDQAQKSLERLKSAINKFRQLNEENEAGDHEKLLIDSARKALESFTEAMNNDFNTPVALSHLFNLVSEVNRYTNNYDSITSLGKATVMKTFTDILNIIGLRLPEVEKGVAADIEELIKILIDVRNVLRSRKEWELADMIRGRLREFGIELQDTPKGTRWVWRRK
jgi:cysteinyl-tRNA synthetase